MTTLYGFVQVLSRAQRRLILLGIDLGLMVITLVLAIALLPQGVPFAATIPGLVIWLPWLLAAAAAFSLILGVANTRISSYDLTALTRLTVFTAGVAGVAALLGMVAWPSLLPGTYVMFGALFLLATGGARFLGHALLLHLEGLTSRKCRVIIYGAGTTGVQLVKGLSSHASIKTVAFVDDNPNLQGLIVAGLRVHAPQRVQELVEAHKIDRVILALPSLSQPKQRQIALRLQKLGLEVQSLPSFSQLVGEEALIDHLAPLEPKLLLGRSEVEAPLSENCGAYADKSVLVTGAGGTIGSELCRQVLQCAPRKLVLLEMSELALYTSHMELSDATQGTGIEIVPVLGSICDAGTVRKALVANDVEVVLHAAAYKHVPLVEGNALSGLINNVMGTWVLAREAHDHGVERFLLISSDKAVRPTNVMGASKRMAELIVQDLASRADPVRGPIYTMVRFGNVLGSSGSVVPLFQEQIRRGGPLTVTHEDVTRYFMTVPEAVRLVLTAGTMARGGEVFVLDMGKPVKIMDLARRAILTSGYTIKDADNPDGDIAIEIKGLRPGEKLYEELLIDAENLSTRHPKIFCAREAALSELEVASMIRRLRDADAAEDEAAARAVITDVVEGYQKPIVTSAVPAE